MGNNYPPARPGEFSYAGKALWNTGRTLAGAYYRQLHRIVPYSPFKGGSVPCRPPKSRHLFQPSSVIPQVEDKDQEKQRGGYTG